MGKYVLKRLLLMIFTFFVIVIICFVLIRMLPRELPTDENLSDIVKDRWNALGYDKPILVQLGIYFKNIFTRFDFGTSWNIEYMASAADVLKSRLLPTVLINLYSLILAIPIGLSLGIIAAIKKNKWQDHFISTIVILFVSIPSYVYAFLVQYLLYYKLKLIDTNVLYSIADVGFDPDSSDSFKAYFTPMMFKSMIMPILALSFGEIASLCRFTRAELTETLSEEYMLLAKAKGLTNRQATVKHALKNAFVPILPMIIASFIGILSGSMIIEEIFSIPGVGQLYIKSIRLLDYDVFMIDTIFYVFIGLLAGIVVDISYGFIDPRIRIGDK